MTDTAPISTDASVTLVSASQPAKKVTKSTLIFRYIRQIVAICVWFYIFTKLFVFDLDVYIFNFVSPHYVWLLQYKFILVTFILALIWLVTKNQYIWSWFLYIFFYPFIFIGKFVFFIFKKKSWIFAFAIINTLISLFKSAKYKFVVSAIFLFSLFLIGIFHNEIAIWASILTLLVLLVIINIRAFILVFKPSSIFELYTRFIRFSKVHIVKGFALDKEIKGVPQVQLNEQQIQKWVGTLQNVVLYNRFLLFLAKKLKDYQESRIGIISYGLGLLIIIFVTVLSFASINFGLYKINPSYFTLTIADPGYFNFLYYSFHNYYFSSILEITPSALLSQVISMLENLFAVFFGVIIVSLCISVFNEKYKEDLSRTIEEINAEGEALQPLLRDEFNLNFEEAMKKIGELKGTLLGIILWLSKGIDD